MIGLEKSQVRDGKNLFTTCQKSTYFDLYFYPTAVAEVMELKVQQNQMASAGAQQPPTART